MLNKIGTLIVVGRKEKEKDKNKKQWSTLPKKNLKKKREKERKATKEKDWIKTYPADKGLNQDQWWQQLQLDPFQSD